MQCVPSGLGTASRVRESSSACFPALLIILSESVSKVAPDCPHGHRCIAAFHKLAVSRLTRDERRPLPNDRHGALHTKIVQSAPNQLAQQDAASPLEGRKSLTPGFAPRAEADKESLHRKWLPSQPSNSSVVRALNAHAPEQQSQSSAGVHRWLAPRQDVIRRHARPDGPRVANDNNDWLPREAPPLNGESHRHLSHTQHHLPPQAGSQRQQQQFNSQETRYEPRDHHPTGIRPQWPQRVHPSPGDGSERTLGAGVSSAGGDGRWRQQQEGRQRLDQPEDQRQHQQRHDHHAETHSDAGTADRGVPPHYGKSDAPQQHRPARPPPRSRPRTRWLGVLKTTEGPTPAAAAPLESKPVDEPAHLSHDEVAEVANESALHRWVVPEEAAAGARQQREPRWSDNAPRPPPAPKPKAKRDWSAYAPPKDNLAAMQEQEQKRYHEMKVRQHLGPQDYQLLQQESMPLPHSGSDKRARKTVQPVPKLEAPEEILLPEDVTVVQLASLLGCGLEKLEETLAGLGEKPASVEDRVEVDIAELAALELGKLAIRSPDAQDRDKDAVPRAPVVTVMGHVDHGKTSLLDALRKTAVAASEAGGITQHIGAFEVALPGSQATATFLDTPGHAAFTSMRARGASVTDIVILVVAANDGIMPQTEEALAHARAAGCPIIVALTKCDMPGAEPSRVKNQLLGLGLQLEEAGGNVMVVETAAPKGVGLAELEEALLLQAEVMDLKASRSGRAEATVVEARRDKGQGPIATVIVKRGCLQVGDYVAVGTEWGRVRSMRSAAGVAMKEALPGQPVEVAGLRGVPQAGDELMVLPSDDRARRVSEARSQRAEEYRHSRQLHAVRLQAAEREAAPDGAPADSAPSQVVLIVKADVQGSAEAVRDSVQALASEAVGVKVIHAGVGPVTSFDIDMASSTGASIVAFNVKNADASVDALAKQKAVVVLQHRVIYRLLEEVGERMAGAAPRVEQESVVGEAQVLQVFEVADKRAGTVRQVAGCRITDGSVRAAARFRVFRAGALVHEGPCASLKRHKLDVERVGKGSECGVLLEGFDEVQQGDVLQCIEVEMVQPAKEAVLGDVSLQNKA